MRGAPSFGSDDDESARCYATVSRACDQAGAAGCRRRVGRVARASFSASSLLRQARQTPRTTAHWALKIPLGVALKHPVPGSGAGAGEGQARGVLLPWRCQPQAPQPRPAARATLPPSSLSTPAARIQPPMPQPRGTLHTELSRAGYGQHPPPQANSSQKSKQACDQGSRGHWPSRLPAACWVPKSPDPPSDTGSSSRNAPRLLASASPST